MFSYVLLQVATGCAYIRHAIVTFTVYKTKLTKLYENIYETFDWITADANNGDIAAMCPNASIAEEAENLFLHEITFSSETIPPAVITISVICSINYNHVLMISV